MTFNELRYLVTLSQTKHFGKAAALCHISQPTLSTAINKLENELGVALFERHHHDIRITDVGEKIIMQAQRTLDELAKIEKIAEGDQSELNSTLKIGGIFTLAPYLFPLLIPNLKKYAPNMPLIVQEDFTVNLRSKLQQGELDAVFVALPFTEPLVVTKPIYDEPFMILMRNDNPLAKKKFIVNSDLKNQNVLLLGQGHCLRDQILEYCPDCANTSELQQIIEGSSLETIRHMVASGLGITILPNSATQVAHYSATLCARPFKDGSAKRTIALAWRASFPRTKAIDALINAIDDCEF